MVVRVPVPCYCSGIPGILAVTVTVPVPDFKILKVTVTVPVPGVPGCACSVPLPVFSLLYMI